MKQRCYHPVVCEPRQTLNALIWYQWYSCGQRQQIWAHDCLNHQEHKEQTAADAPLAIGPWSWGQLTQALLARMWHTVRTLRCRVKLPINNLCAEVMLWIDLTAKLYRCVVVCSTTPSGNCSWINPKFSERSQCEWADFACVRWHLEKADLSLK